MNVVRIAAMVLCVGIACVLAAALVIAAWLNLVVFDTERYVDAVAPLWAEPSIQEKAAREIGQHLTLRIDVATTVGRALPGAPQSARETAVDRMRSTLPSLTSELGHAYVSSVEFEQVWRDANASAHKEVVGQLAGPNDVGTASVVVTVDIAGVAKRASEATEAIVLRNDAARDRPRTIELLDPGEFARPRVALQVLHGRWGFVALALVLVLACAAMLATEWRRPLIWFGLGSTALALLLLAVTYPAMRFLVRRLSDWNLSPESVTAWYEAVARSFRGTVAAGALAGLTVAAALWLGGMLARRERKGTTQA